MKCKRFTFIMILVIIIFYISITSSKKNRYKPNPSKHDYTTVNIEGDTSLVYKLFTKSYKENPFIIHIGSNFGYTKSATHYEDDIIIFTDITRNKLYSYSNKKGFKLFINNCGDLELKKTEKELYGQIGCNSILVDIEKDDIYITQHYNRRVSFKNMETLFMTLTVADNVDNENFNGPYSMTWGPKRKYIYFTDTSSTIFETRQPKLDYNGIFRVKLSNNKVDKLGQLSNPNGIKFGNNKNILFVSNCISGKFELNKYKLINKGTSLKLIEKWDEQHIFKNADKSIKDICPKNIKDEEWLFKSGCVDGFDIHKNGYVITSCPCQKICILDENSGTLLAVIRMPDNQIVSGVSIIDDDWLFITGNYSLWQIKMNDVGQQHKEL